MQEDVELLVLTFAKDVILNDPYIDDTILQFFQERSKCYVNFISNRTDHSGTIRRALFSAWQEWNDKLGGKNMMIKAALLQILACLSRYYSGSRANLETVRKNRRDLIRLDQGLRYLDTHFNEKISIQDVAFASGMSPSYFSKLFHRIMGITYTDYLAQKRVYQANEMLETTEKNVVDVATECGFNSIANFYRTYRKYYQKAPRQEPQSPEIVVHSAKRDISE